MNTHNASVFDQLYPNCVYHSGLTGEIKGEAIRRFFAGYFLAFPDLRITIEDQFAEGDRLVTRWSFTGTHKGEFIGIAASSKQVKGTGMCIDRVVKGKIVEGWVEWDALGMMSQLGVVPAKLEEPVAA